MFVNVLFRSVLLFFFFSSRRRHTRWPRDWSSDVCSSDLSAGYSIIPSARGRGLATDALRALTDFGWGVPGLERIVLYVEPWNIASIRTAVRSGYVREELLRDQEVAGAVRDDVRFAALRGS